jgi:hypothetical protein
VKLPIFLILFIFNNYAYSSASYCPFGQYANYDPITKVFYCSTVPFEEEEVEPDLEPMQYCNNDEYYDEDLEYCVIKYNVD